MAQNTLKQKARLFAQKHGLPYATALRAVDEPLHQLREASLLNSEIDGVNHFRLTGVDSTYSSAYDVPLRSRERTPSYVAHIGQMGLSEYEGSMAMVSDMSRRFELLESVQARNIWEYRELQRSGKFGKLEPLEPFFHHFGTKIQSSYEIIYTHGSKLGIFAVSIAPYYRISDAVELIPLTLNQFEALKVGKDAGKVDFPGALPFDNRRLFSEPNYMNEATFHETDSFALIARSERDIARDGVTEVISKPRLQILFRSDDLEVAARKVRELGMDPSAFSFEAFPMDEVRITRRGDQIAVSSEDYSSSIVGSCQAILLV